MQNLVDKVQYSECGNEITLIKLRDQHDQDEKQSEQATAAG
jgi:hypothetical protein